MRFESTLGWKLLYREELREEAIIDAHRYTAVVAIHVHLIVTHHGQSFKTPRRIRLVHGSVRRASGFVLTSKPEVVRGSFLSVSGSGPEKEYRGVS
jgi:hypothetical protein